MSTKIQIGKLSEFQGGKTVKFQIPEDDGDFREGFAFFRKDQYYCYFNECAHISIPLDWNDNDFFDIEERSLVCKNHGAEFVPETGECTIGPCVGAKLKSIGTEIENETLFAVFP